MYITEGSKNYIKAVLEVLSEESPKYLPPGVQQPAEFDEPGPPNPDGTPYRSINQRGKKSTRRHGGRGGEGFMQDEKTGKIPGQGSDRWNPPAGDKSTMELSPEIMFGVKSAFKTLHPRYSEGDTSPEAKGEGLDFVTDIAQAYSLVDAADQYMPGLVRLGLGLQNLGSKVRVDPTGSKTSGGKPGTTTASSSGPPLPSDVQKLIGTATGIGSEIATKHGIGTSTAPTQKQKFVSNVMKFSQNLGALDPFNPLLGTKIGLQMLGGDEIIKRTRGLGSAQTAGAESSMGHPSAMGYFGR